jgi:hypothetical protein
VDRNTHHIVDDGTLHLVNRLQLLKAVRRTRQAQSGRLVHETQLGINVGLLLLLGERVPCLSLHLGLVPLALIVPIVAIITAILPTLERGSCNRCCGAGKDGQGGQAIGEQHGVDLPL